MATHTQGDTRFPGSATYLISQNLCFLFCMRKTKSWLPNLTGKPQKWVTGSCQTLRLLPATWWVFTKCQQRNENASSFIVQIFTVWVRWWNCFTSDLKNACYKKYKEMKYLQKNRHEKWMAMYLSLSFWTPSAWVISFHTHPLLPLTPTTLFWSKCKTWRHFHCKHGFNLSQKNDFWFQALLLLMHLLEFSMTWLGEGRVVKKQCPY